jgi:hypothetical protein
MDSITLILSPLHKEHPDGINMTNMPFDTTAHRNEFSASSASARLWDGR